MTLDQFYDYQEKPFDAFCKAVIRNEAINEHKRLAALAEKEVPLSALSSSELAALHYEDTYHPYRKTYYVQGLEIHVYDKLLGEVLQYLAPQRRDVILLFYFLGYSDSEIARTLHISNPTVNNRRNAGLRRLRELLEDLDNA